MPRIFTVDLTRPFIDELAACLQRAYPGADLGRVAVVFGGKRPAHFLMRELARRFGSALVPPRFYTIDEFIDGIACGAGASVPMDDLEARFLVYELARELTPSLLEGREAFAQFLPWAGDILGLIEQLDLEDVDDGVLRNIEQSARIGFPVPDGINSLLEHVMTLRRAFHERLTARGCSSRGLRYLRASRHVAQWDITAFDEIVFANFFYFHRTEEAVARHLYRAGKATLVFQGDQRKWPVLERMARAFGCDLTEGAAPTPTTFDLRAYSVFDVHAEAAVVRDILADIPDRGRAVVVVPEAGALVPLLSALPDDPDGINVSMGYSLERSSLHLLVQAVFRAQLSRRDGKYYARDYLNVIRHPLVKSLSLGVDPTVMRVLAHKLEDLLRGRITGAVSGCSFVALDDIAADGVLWREVMAMGPGIGETELKALWQDVHAVLFTAWEPVCTLSSFGAALVGLLDIITQKSAMAFYPLNMNIAGKLYDLAGALGGVSLAQEPFALEDVIRIVETRIGREMVSFSGTPLKGLQVLGLFETRSLNFDHVIIMDVNEGVLPRVESHASLVPREVMGLLKIDRLELEEEIQRYQFMRLISSAKKVHLVYQKNNEKEPSRFLEELVWEKQRQAGRLEPYPTLRAGFRVEVAGAGLERREAGKTPKMMTFLRDFTYSATSINAYLANPYTFYMTYGLGLKPEEDLLDEPDAALVGDLWHSVLEEGYKPFEGGPLVLDDAFERRLFRIFERKFDEVFARRMRSDAFLVRGVMEHKLRAFVEAERERAPQVARLVALEKDFGGVIPLSVGEIRFKARVDRIEEDRQGNILLLDYKTGSTDRLPRKASVLSPFPAREEIFETVGSFQLPLYMYFVSRQMPGVLLNAGLYGLRDAKITAFPAPQKPGLFLEPYLHALDALMRELLDPARPFVDDELRKFEF